MRLNLRGQVRWSHDEVKVVLSDADLVQIWSRLRLFASSRLVFLVCGLLRSCLAFLAGATGLDKVMRKQVKRRNQVLGILLAVVAEGAFLLAIGGLFERLLMTGVLGALLGVDGRPCSSSWLRSRP